LDLCSMVPGADGNIFDPKLLSPSCVPGVLATNTV
jgi:hypothetical protein